MINLLRFAACITMPGTTASDVVNAAVKHSVHILDKQPYDPDRDYDYYSELYGEAGISISHLFIFPGGSILSEDELSFRDALERLKTM